MRKYEVDRVHNSKDDEIYQIAQSVEQKVRTGMLMPDYEMSQKPFHHWGDVILNYMNPEKMAQEDIRPDFRTNRFDFFETTFTTEERMDGEWYVTNIKVDAQSLKLNKKQSRDGGICSYNYAVSFVVNEDGILDYYNYEDDDFMMVIDDGSCDRHNRMHLVDKVSGLNNKFNIKLNLLQNKTIEVRSTTTFINKAKIKAYSTFRDLGSNIHNRGLIISHKRKWILIEDNNIDNICVKHGGMKYVNGNETIWKLTKKNIFKPSTNGKRYGRGYDEHNNLGVWYNSYTDNRFGRRGGRNRVHTRKLSWIKCFWLNINDFTPKYFHVSGSEKIMKNIEIIKLLLKRRKHWKRRGSELYEHFNGDYLGTHFIKANIEENCFELWNFISISGNYNSYSTNITPLFLKNLTPEDGWNIIYNRNKKANKIVIE